MPIFRENSWIIDETTAKKIQNSNITVRTGYFFRLSSSEVLEFLRSLNVVRVNSLMLSMKEFSEADLDLIRMTEKDSTLSIKIGEMSSSLYFSNSYSSELSVEIIKKQIVPNDIKSIFNTFLFELDSILPLKDIKIYDNIFFIVSDLIEHVLENKENKRLVLREPVNKRMDIIYELLVQNVQSKFEQREYFANITIEEQFIKN